MAQSYAGYVFCIDLPLASEYGCVANSAGDEMYTTERLVMHSDILVVGRKGPVSDELKPSKKGLGTTLSVSGLSRDWFLGFSCLQAARLRWRVSRFALVSCFSLGSCYVQLRGVLQRRSVSHQQWGLA